MRLGVRLYYPIPYPSWFALHIVGSPLKLFILTLSIYSSIHNIIFLFVVALHLLDFIFLCPILKKIQVKVKRLIISVWSIVENAFLIRQGYQKIMEYPFLHIYF